MLFKFKYISHKFIFPVIILLLITFSILTMQIMQRERMQRSTALEEDIKRSIEMINLSLVEPLYNYDNTTAENIAQALFADPRITKLKVIDDFDAEVVTLNREEKGDISTIETEINREDQLIGALEVEFSDYYLEKEIAEIRNNLIFSVSIYYLY